MDSLLFGNGKAPSVTELRRTVAQLGLDADGNKTTLLNRLGEYQRRGKARRLECAKLGLATDGTLDDLEIRLAAAEANTTTSHHRRGYRASLVLGIILGLAGLAVSVPHMAEEIATLMGISMFYGTLCALVVDGGFVTLKVMDSLRDKFRMSATQKSVIWSVMFLCLTMAACLNASNFVRHVSAERVPLAIGLAVFLAVFVFSMFYMGTSMAMRCEPVTVTDDTGTSRRLRRAAAELDRLQKAANSC